MRIRLLVKCAFIVIGGLVGVALIGIAVAYVVIGNNLARTFDVTGKNIVVLDDVASVAEGERLARLRGCAGSCHGDNLHGAVLIELPDGTRVVGPDLAAAARLYSIEQLELIIRHGIRPDGTSVIGLMPSYMYYHINDRDLGAIIAYLKDQEPGHDQLPKTWIGPVARLLFVYIGQKLGGLLAAERIEHNAPRVDYKEGDALGHGQYLAVSICSECHGADLRGDPMFSSPSLAIVVAYSLENFRNLMLTGEPIGGRELDVMKLLAKERFGYLRDREVESLHTYLKTLAATDDGH